MSDLKKEQFLKDLEKEKEFDKKKREFYEKKLVVDDRKVSKDLETIKENEKNLEIAKSTNYGQMSEEQISELRRNNIEYIEGARNGMEFINKAFLGCVPFFRKNLILIGGKTGEGKSTTVANIIRSTIRQTNPATGRRRRALVITNEEKSEDVYNRVTCQTKGWHYTNHDKFTDEQVKTFDEFIPILAKDGWLTVVDNNYNGSYGTTTTLEGIETIFNNLIRDKEYYDVVIIDYYQNIKSSSKQIHLNEYEVQAMLANRLDQYKNVYPAPIVLMAQVTPPDEKKTPFEFRIKGRKVITDPSTLIMEMVADRQNLRTEWIIHKSRFTESIGSSFFTGYDYGRFVEYDDNFIKKIAKFKEDREYSKVFKSVFVDDKEKKE